ncbi:hypothetical protein LTR56_022341 [Elasticomyces elasticus]|nr:hypothetical protein LTR56_022341 [Elasticomyces elasticus]KAK3629005.1 hypothetical protein LTR22_022081 [Elasticomyces elasticus]KAK4908542.1 hypothetical protein LTR49_022565 [Elasticomyces elasticus]KAK5747007.1 hypothetical protein LTS12_022523 [Elasticomyces elasticus]
MSTVKTRILIISDTHCAVLTRRKDGGNVPHPPFSAPLPPADLLILAGDLTMTGKIEEYHRALDMLKDIEAPVKLVIAGNHDYSLDSDFMLSHLEPKGLTKPAAEFEIQEAHDLWMAPEGRARLEGVTFLEEGVHSVDLENGARVKVYASPYTPEYQDWGFPYEHDEDRYNTRETSLSDAKNIAPSPVPSFTATDMPIDILLTHGPPYQNMSQTTTGDDAGCPHLLRALMRGRPLLHCFGHIHEGWGAEIVKWSDRADEIATAPTSIADWKDGAWHTGVAHNGLQSVSVNHEKMLQRHAAYLDVSRDGSTLRRGQETVLVNAAIMDVNYEPVNAPWLIDIELPLAK